MTTMEAALCAWLENDADIAAVVDDRIEPRRNSQGLAMPRICLWRTSGARLGTLQGPSGLSNPRIRISCIAATYDIAKNLSELVRLSIDGFRGDMAGVDVQHILMADENDNDDPQPGDDQLAAFIINTDYDILHNEVHTQPAWADVAAADS